MPSEQTSSDVKTWGRAQKAASQVRRRGASTRRNPAARPRLASAKDRHTWRAGRKRAFARLQGAAIVLGRVPVNSGRPELVIWFGVWAHG